MYGIWIVAVLGTLEGEQKKRAEHFVSTVQPLFGPDVV